MNVDVQESIPKCPLVKILQQQEIEGTQIL